jgi:hypothetical protein
MTTPLVNPETGATYVPNPHEINNKGDQVAGQAAEMTDGKAREVKRGVTHSPGLHVPPVLTDASVPEPDGDPLGDEDHVSLSSGGGEIQPGDAVSPPLEAGEKLPGVDAD